jgi:hypothetical protein
MIFVILILIYCLLVIIKRILKPRVFPRRCDYNLENNLCFVIICGLYIVYKIFVQKMTLQGVRWISMDWN